MRDEWRMGRKDEGKPRDSLCAGGEMGQTL